MGKRDVLKHIGTPSHKDLAKSVQTQTKLQFSAPDSTSKSSLVAELKMAVLTACSNIPQAFHDKLSPTIREVFSDSKVAKNYHSASTKATCMLNLAVAPILIQELLEIMKKHPGFFLEYNFRGGKSTFLEIEGGINKKSQG